MSKLCPETHGYAVRVARTMANIIGEPLQCLHKCEEFKEPRKSTRLSKETMVQVHPNPSQGYIYIISPEDGIVNIRNVL